MEKTFALEEKIAEIRKIVEHMQKGVSDFDEQVALFKKGKDLIQACQAYLNQAEMEVKKLVDGEMEDFDAP